MASIEKLLKIADELECEAYKSAPMKEYTSFRIGGPADLLVIPDSSIKLQRLLKECRSSGLKTFVIGKGSNILVSDLGIRGVVFCTSELNKCELTGDRTLECYAGASLSALCNFALDNELSGLEFAYGIPGSVGGAACMNAGAYGGEMKDVIFSCCHITPDNNFDSIYRDNVRFSYRDSVYSTNGCIITSLCLQLSLGDKREIRQKMNEVLELRKDKQPLEYPSAGSVFKRPKDNYASALIDECGLKGKRIGDAEVSVKHAGFIVNKGNASASDVLRLIEVIQETVIREKGIVLETEIKLV